MLSFEEPGRFKSSGSVIVQRVQWRQLIDSDDPSMEQTKAEEDSVLARRTVINHLWRLSQFSLISKFLVNHLKDKTSSIIMK